MRNNVSTVLKSVLIQVLLVVALCFVIGMVVDYARQPAQLQGMDVSNTYMTTIDGQSISLTQTDTLTVIYFWGTWCPVCKHTSPQVQKFVNNDNVNVVSVAMDSGTNDEIATYLSTHQLSFTTVNDADSSMSTLWGVQVVPTIVVVDDDQVIQSFTGFNSYPMMRFKIWLAQLVHK